MNLTKPLIGYLAFSLAACAFAQERPRNSDIENIGSRDINKGTINFYSIEKEIAVGRQLSAEYERTVKIVSDPDVTEYINRLGQNIVINSDAKDLPVVFKVVDSSEFNAQAFPGGFVYVNAGTIAAVDNEAELAFALAYQVAHIAGRHGTENSSKMELVNTANIPVTFRTGLDVFSLRQAADSLTPMQVLQSIRGNVMEADFLGLQYLYKAGFDPNAAISLIQKIEMRETPPPNNGSRLFSPTPPAADRIAAIRKNIALILPARARNVVTTPEFEKIKAGVKK